MPRKTDSGNPADWLWIADSDLTLIRLGAEQAVGYNAVRSKLAEVLEKVLKAELIRTGWPLEKTHDLRKLASELQLRKSDLEEQFRPLVVALAEVYFVDRSRFRSGRPGLAGVARTTRTGRGAAGHREGSGCRI